MRKSIDNESRAINAIRMIKKDRATWDDVGGLLKLSVSYCQKLVKEYYNDNNYEYKRLLADARMNKKMKMDAKNELLSNKVVVVETGYLLDEGTKAITEETLEMFITTLDMKELKKMSKVVQVAEDILLTCYVAKNLTVHSMNDENNLFKETTVPVEERVVGVVALCCQLWSKGYKIILKTKSREIEQLAKMQGIDIEIK